MLSHQSHPSARKQHRAEPPTGRHRPVNPWPIYFGATFLFAVTFYFWRVALVPKEVHLIGVLLWMLYSLPLTLWFWRGRKGLPMFEILCLTFCAAYCMPIYLVPRSIVILSQSESLSWEVTTRALLLVGLGVSAMMAAFYAVRNTVGSFIPLDLPMTPKKRIEYAYLALAIGGGVRFLVKQSGDINPAFGAVTALLTAQFNIGLIMLGYGIVSDRQTSSFHLLALYVGMAFGFVVGLLSGTLSNAFLPVAVVIFVRWQTRLKFPLILAVVAAGAFLIFNSAKVEYRNRIWYGSDSGLSAGRKMGVWVEAVQNIAASRQNVSYDNENASNLAQAAERVGLLNKFAHVLKMTPGEVPYFEGKMYNYFFYTFIPRMVWPSKPSVKATEDLTDFSYNLRSPDGPDTGTRIGIGLVAEAYANFGVVGIPVVMSLFGLVFGLLDKMLNGPQSVGGRAIYLSIMVLFLNGIGTAAVVLFGSVFQITIANAVIMRPFATGYSMPPPRRIRRIRQIETT